MLAKLLDVAVPANPDAVVIVVHGVAAAAIACTSAPPSSRC